jgi:F420-dependent oxidoreductase-like protein
MRVGLKLYGQGRTVGEQRQVWRIADEGGFDHCWVSDHFAAIDEDPTLDVLEAWAMLAAMAEATTRVRIGCLVTGNTFRHPGVLAKMAVTVDHLSNGRLEFAIGAGWAEAEHTMLGLEFGTAGQRVDRLGEACQIVKLLWTKESCDFTGRFYEIRQATANPKPLQTPHPPIWIGGAGERKTLRVVAEHASVWNAPEGRPDEIARLSSVLDGHCVAIGRSPADIRRSVQFRFDAGTEQILQVALEYAAIGMDDIVMVLMSDRPVEQAEQATELLSTLRSRLGGE